MEIRSISTLASAALSAALIGAAITLFVLRDQPRREPVTISHAADTPLSARAVGPVSYADAVQRASPAVVNIYTTRLVRQRVHPLLQDPMIRRFFGEGAIIPKQRLARIENSLGSAVIVSPDGYLLTNNHVIAEADEIFASMADGNALPAKLVGSDPDSDIAVLKIGASDLPAITFGSSDTLAVGDVVLAIGNPFGVGKAVTMGIVSATGRSDLGINTFEDFIQTDAAINPGNSGGALVNARGELVGINTAIFSKTGASIGIGFAIPAKLAEGVMQQIITHGRAVRGWLGIRVQDVTTELAESMGLDASNGGVLIAGTLEKGPADRAGVEPGDFVTAIDGVAVRDARHLLNLIARHAPGTALKLEALRGNQTIAIDALAGERPAILDQ
ncbi:MAG: trypsin-like peptidase domain-containing protein [Chromatiales bacterium]|nr:trypsin-like peptidase domain-containing protein [Chromatiales bacterium]